MSAAELRERIHGKLLRDIDEGQFPSTTMLNRVESALADRESLERYAEMLVEKIEATRFPSVALLDRLDAVLARLEREEQRAAPDRRA